MIPAYITFVVDNNCTDANNTNIADDIEMSSINGNDDDEYLLHHYDNDLNHQDMSNVVMPNRHAAIINLDVDDDDTMGTIIRPPEYKESSRVIMMMADGFGCIDSCKKEDNCYINTNYVSNYNYNSNSNYNYNCDNNYTNNNNSTNIISYECGSLFEDCDVAMFPSETIITVD